MTLRATIEIIPFGNESKAKKLMTLNISNVTESEGHGPSRFQDTYVVEKDDYKNYDDVTPRVFHFRSDGFEVLVQKALEAIK